MKCDRCGEEVSTRHTLRNVYYSDGVISQLESTLKVCGRCRKDIKKSEYWEI